MSGFHFLCSFCLFQICSMSMCYFVVRTNINSINSGSYRDNNKSRKNLITRRHVECLFKQQNLRLGKYRGKGEKPIQFHIHSGPSHVKRKSGVGTARRKPSRTPPAFLPPSLQAPSTPGPVAAGGGGGVLSLGFFLYYPSYNLGRLSMYMKLTGRGARTRRQREWMLEMEHQRDIDAVHTYYKYLFP